MINLQPYENPAYFIILGLALLPLIVGLYFGKRLRVYQTLFTLVFLVLTFGGSKWHEGLALIAYVVFQFLLVWLYHLYRSKKNSGLVFTLFVIASILPLAIVKITPAVPHAGASILGFLGISYLTFKTVQMIMEMRDGTIKTFEPVLFLQFLLFFPTISSGPIDRFRRFKKNYVKVPTREKYLELMNKGMIFLFQGFVYKFMLGYLFGTLWLPQAAEAALVHRGALGGTGLSWALLAYMYIYSMYLFFDFAGYSLFAISISYFMGIETPVNFNKPFAAHNIKEFWNRWHMTLSFWFRDFIFMRFTFFMMKHRWIKDKIRLSQVAYLVDFLIMGFWHGVTWYYVVYGLFHALAIILNDTWLRYKKKHPNLPHNIFTEGLSIFLTFNVVCLSFLIFSGFLNTLWFKA